MGAAPARKAPAQAKDTGTAADRNPLTVLVLAGSRPGPDPLLEGTGLSTKALLPIAGAPMLAHVLTAFEGMPGVDKVIVAAQEVEALPANPAIAPHSVGIDWRHSAPSIAQTVDAILREIDGPLLVTTADNVLVTRAIIDEFLAGTAQCDVAVAVVERGVVERAGHSTKRTWLHFRGGSYSGANLFYLRDASVLPLVAQWARIEQDRKKGRQVLAAFGVLPLVGVAARILSIRQFAASVGKRFEITACPVELTAGEACIDADKPADIALIERILAERSAQA